MQNDELFQDAERVTTHDEDGEHVWVVLAQDTFEGMDLVLLADEGELLGPGDDMHVAVFRSVARGERRQVEPLDDEELEERAYEHFVELMGLEGA